VAAIDCGRTPSEAASPLAVAAPLLLTSVSADTWEGGEVLRLTRRLGDLPDPPAQPVERDPEIPRGTGGGPGDAVDTFGVIPAVVHAPTLGPSVQTVQFELHSPG
jgi:hypothetical protein